MPLSIAMLPVATLLYNQIGIERIFLFSAVGFFIAACFNTQVRADETHLRGKAERYSFSEFKTSFFEGFNYIKEEKGLLVITLYFAITTFTASCDALFLPYFRDTPHLGVMLYGFVMGSTVVGRFIGGLIQYRLDYPTNKKFAIALFVYFFVAVSQTSLLFLPVYLMIALAFLNGLLSVTSYNIRVSTTQSYVPDAKRARFNGTFFMFMNAGAIIGQLVSGAIADYIPIRAVVIVCNAIALVTAYAVMWRGRRHVIPIYNRVV